MPLHKVKNESLISLAKLITIFFTLSLVYVNHRPAFGLQPEKLDVAFRVLGYPVKGIPTVDRGELLDVLQNRGKFIIFLKFY